MTYSEDNTGNLYQADDRSWRIRFDKSDFKNERGAANTDYDVPIPKQVWPFIVEYIRGGRPYLMAGRKTDLVFLSSDHETKMWQENGISVRLGVITAEYIPEFTDSGFGAHAFRHIAGTEYIKNHPEGFEVAAAILHDKPETVRREYAHVKAADKMRVWNDYLAVQDAMELPSFNWGGMMVQKHTAHLPNLDTVE